MGQEDIALMQNKLKLVKVVWYKSLGFSILLWFLLLSLVPILIISYESNEISVQGLKEAAIEDLTNSTTLKKKFINNWFYYRKVDLSAWSQTKLNLDFLTLLNLEFSKSSKSLKNFVKSDRYLKIKNKYEYHLLKLAKEYDHVYDILLIDNSGNILYNITQEDDLGTNLVKGKHSLTKFASSFMQTLKDGKIHFSDLENYKPSANIKTGFLTSPMFDDSGKSIGVIAIELKIERISSLFLNDVTKTNNYVLTKDGLMISDKSSKLYNSRVDASTLRKWYEKHLHVKNIRNEEEITSTYKNPFFRKGNRCLSKS